MQQGLWSTITTVPPGRFVENVRWIRASLPREPARLWAFDSETRRSGSLVTIPCSQLIRAASMP
jgi:hypothetical protein